MQEEDIEFNLICTKIQDLTENETVHTYDFMIAEGITKYPNSFSQYVEWGTATTVLPFEQISDKLKEYLREYRSPHGGVSMGISSGSLQEDSYKNKYNLLNDVNKQMREELFRCLGLERHADFDEFASKFGGVTKAEILERKL